MGPHVLPRPLWFDILSSHYWKRSVTFLMPILLAIVKSSIVLTEVLKAVDYALLKTFFLFCHCHCAIPTSPAFQAVQSYFSTTPPHLFTPKCGLAPRLLSCFLSVLEGLPKWVVSKSSRWIIPYLSSSIGRYFHPCRADSSCTHELWPLKAARVPIANWSHWSYYSCSHSIPRSGTFIFESSLPLLSHTANQLLSVIQSCFSAFCIEIFSFYLLQSFLC